MRRSGRPLSLEELRLWAEISRSVRPLSGRPEPEAGLIPQRPDAREPGSAGPAQPPVKAGDGRSPARPRPPLAPLERKTIRALARGRMRAELTLDLHGLTQAEAHRALHAFLCRAYAAGRTLVLVVTGRGALGNHPEGRGVLRRTVPHWLALPEMREMVLGFEEAGPRQGGAGAIYVRLRGQRPRGPQA